MAGLGTYRQRGKNGNSWELRFDAPRDEKGKRKRRHVTVRGDEKAAQTKLVALLRERDTGSAVDPSKTTVGQYLDTWHGELRVQPKTAERYETLIRNQIKPHLGNVVLQELKPAGIKAWHKTLREKGGTRGGPLADRTCLHAHRVLSKALKDAAAIQLIGTNPAALIEQPKVMDAKEIEILKNPAAVLKALAGHDLHALAHLGLASGMRRGELLGLRWPDVELDKAVVRVEQSLEQTKQACASSGRSRRPAGARSPCRPPRWRCYASTRCASSN